jgi:predicted transcriptional regulator
MKPSNTSAQN